MYVFISAWIRHSRWFIVGSNPASNKILALHLYALREGYKVTLWKVGEQLPQLGRFSLFFVVISQADLMGSLARGRAWACGLLPHGSEGLK